MLTNLFHLKIILFIALLLAVFVPNLCINVDSINCEKSTQLPFPHVADPQLKYYLFTSDNYIEGQEIEDQNLTSIEESKFNKNWPTRIFIPSWKTTVKHCKIPVIRDAYFEIGDFNFIVADWSNWNTREYSDAAASVDIVGQLLGFFTKFLNSFFEVDFDDIYLIGHGLGAHVAGIAGASISPNQYDTIYGLDPAGDEFIEMPPESRLDPSDAKYVEVIITDMYVKGFRTNEILGDVQFYPFNGRRVQPPCSHDLVDNFIPGEQFCSHFASVDYLANALNSEIKFCGIPTTWDNIFSMYVPQNNGSCDVIMGGEPSNVKTGYYYVSISYTNFLPA